MTKYYHGTSLSNFESIRLNGLKVEHCAGGTAEECLDDKAYEGERGRAVYFTRDIQWAMGFGESLAGRAYDKAYLLVTIELPDDMEKEEDWYDGHDSFYVTYDILPQYIVEIDTLPAERYDDED